MRATEFLIERATDVLFHYTGIRAGLKILQSGNFELASVTGTRSEEQYAPPGYPYFLSLTRTITGDYHRWVGSGAVMFKLNGDWFNSRYIVKPIDYWDRAWLHSNGTRTRESEDRVFSKEPTIPITPVTEVHVLLKEQNEYRSPETRQILITAKQQGLPVFFYTDEAAWRLLDKRRAQKPAQARDVLRGPQPAGYSRKPTDFVKPWIELITKNDEAHLSERAKRALKTMRYYGNAHEDQNLSVDLSNARKPDSGDRASAVWIIKYMQDNNFKSTLELKNAISDKWDAIFKAKQAAAQPAEDMAEGRGSGYKEIEFVCANPEFPDATDPELQKQLYAGLRQIPGVIPLFQDQSDYSEGQYSLTAIYKDRAVRGQILKLAKQLGVSVDLEQPVTDDYVDRAIRGEHEGQQDVSEEWSQKYKSSINCSHPKGFSQRAHCAGKNKHNESVEMEMVCEDCGMCQTHGNLNEIKKGQKDSNGYTRCWPGKHAEGTKTGKNGGQVRNCVPNESIEEAGSPAQQAAIAIVMKKAGKKPKSLDEQFDMIENMVEQLAEAHGVDADEIWEDFESVDDHELLDESAAWHRKAGKNPKGGLNAKGVASYRAEHPGSHLQMAVTTKPSKLKPGSKAAKRRKSFCARMSGVDGPMKKPNGKPTRKALALRKWNC